MSTDTTPRTGGFAGSPEEAFAPAAAGGCCGSAPAQNAANTTVASTCCGTAAQAKASGGCCGETAKADAIAAGASCCG